MRVRAILLALSILWPLIPADAAGIEGAHFPQTSKRSNCPLTANDLAQSIASHREGPLMPKKLTELPPGIAYMAVYRHIGNCDAPLTMVDYRNSNGR